MFSHNHFIHNTVMFWLMFPLFLLSTSIIMVLSETNNFGPYQVGWERFVVCKGPKNADCGTVRVENTKNMSDVIFVMDMTRDCPITKARVTISAKQSNNSTKKLWNYSLDSPCQHFVLGPILVESFNLTNTCKINKGHYVVHVDMVAKSTMFLGSSFFYGAYVFKIFAHNKNHNFFCVDTTLVVEKKSS